jgi:hypothetical protein
VTKRLAFDFIGLYTNILADIGVYFPNDQLEWERDIKTLTRLASTRGQSTFTIDLPALGKVLDRSLSDGRLDLHGLNLSGSRHPNSKIPRLFWGLWSRLFDDAGCLKIDIDPNVVFFLRTVLYCGKNLEWDCAPKYLFQATKEFYDVEARLPVPSQFWDETSDSDVSIGATVFGSLTDIIPRKDLYEDSSSRDRLFDLLTCVQKSADRMSGLIGLVEVDKLNFRHGPGAVSDLRSGSYKYSFPGWSDRLDQAVPFSEFGCTPIGMMDRLSLDGLDVDFSERSSRLIAVPKTQKGPRLIAAEPLANQWVQQGVRDVLYRQVRSTSLRESLGFESQEISRTLALRSSVDRRLATVDLKSASDSVSCWLVQRAFRRNEFLLRLLRACRTRYLSNGLDKKRPELTKLRKFSCQGSALTFPIQSLIFYSIAVGVGKYLNRWKSYSELSREVRVFGDDIILPVQWEPLLEEVLDLLFLKVNRSKTFVDGYFRESCGMDAWEGYDVTPPHVTMRSDESDPRTIASNVAVSNNFFKKGLWNASHWLRTTITDRLLPIVGMSSGVFGFTSFVGGDARHLKLRWNANLHRTEARVMVISAMARRLKTNSAASLLQYFTEEPAPYVKYESGITVAGVPVKKHAWVPLSDLGLVAPEWSGLVA